MDCVYLGAEQPGKLGKNGNQLFDCLMHGQCTTEGDPVLIASCSACRDRLPLDAPDLADRFKDSLHITDRRNGRTDALCGMLTGCPAFLVCGGPSAKDQPLEELGGRGPWSLAINNAAGFGTYGPNAFVCSDPPSKFCDGIWMDPRIMKFIPTPKMRRKRGRLRSKRIESSHFLSCGRKCKGAKCQRCKGTGKYETWFDQLVDGEDKMVSACDAPNVWGFERRAWMMPDDSFFLEPSASWGNHDVGSGKTNQPKTVCTMLLGMRILYYLGARTIYLVGVDFNMDTSRQLLENYSFDEERDNSACQSNNRQFEIVNEWLCKMTEDGVFEKFGLSVFNTNRESHLRAFSFVPFDVAISEATKRLPSQPYDLSGWYFK